MMTMNDDKDTHDHAHDDGDDDHGAADSADSAQAASKLRISDEELYHRFVLLASSEYA